jgi:hypothetical protein
MRSAAHFSDLLRELPGYLRALSSGTARQKSGLKFTLAERPAPATYSCSHYLVTATRRATVKKRFTTHLAAVRQLPRPLLSTP